MFMGEIIILDKSKADILLSLGYQYSTQQINNTDVYVFIQTEELLQYIVSKFDKQSFVIKKNVCF